MQNLFRRFTIMFDYMQQESDKSGFPTYILRWTCNQCHDRGQSIFLGHYGAIQDYASTVMCKCPSIGEQQNGINQKSV